MTNAELTKKAAALESAAAKIAGLSTMALMTSDVVKKAALLEAEITGELARREIERSGTSSQTEEATA